MKCLLFYRTASFALVLLLVLNACTSSNEEDDAPQPQPQTCDLSNVTFSQTITPILSSNCYSCHSAGTEEGGVVLNSYAGVKKQADNGNLIGVITHASGFPPMPQGAAKLSECNISKIKKWVAEGAPNN